MIIVYRAFLAFGSEGDAEAFYYNNKHITFLLLDILLTVATVIGDLPIVSPLSRFQVFCDIQIRKAISPVDCMVQKQACGSAAYL
jgi:hypothetical protein